MCDCEPATFTSLLEWMGGRWQVCSVPVPPFPSPASPSPPLSSPSPPPLPPLPDYLAAAGFFCLQRGRGHSLFPFPRRGERWKLCWNSMSIRMASRSICHVHGVVAAAPDIWGVILECSEDPPSAAGDRAQSLVTARCPALEFYRTPSEPTKPLLLQNTFT